MNTPRTDSHARGEAVSKLSAVVGMFLEGTTSVRLNHPNTGAGERRIVMTRYNACATLAYRSYSSWMNNATGEYSQVVKTQTFFVVFDDERVYMTDPETILNNIPRPRRLDSQLRRILQAIECGEPVPPKTACASKAQIDQIYNDLTSWLP